MDWRAANTRRTLRLISLCILQGAWLYYSPHYRTVLQCLLAVGFQMVAVVIICTAFPYEKKPPQAKDTSPGQYPAQ